MYQILFSRRSIFRSAQVLQPVSKRRLRGVERYDTDSHPCCTYDLAIENDSRVLSDVDCMKSQYRAAEGTSIAECEAVISPASHPRAEGVEMPGSPAFA